MLGRCGARLALILYHNDYIPSLAGQADYNLETLSATR